MLFAKTVRNAKAYFGVSHTMRNLLIAAALALVPGHIVAQELDERYTQVGTFSGTVDSTTVELIGTFDHEREK